MTMYEKLENSSLFKGLTSEEIKLAINSIKYSLTNYKIGETVVFRGDNVNGFYINIRGIVTAEMLKATGQIQKIEDLEEGTVAASAFIFGKENIFPVDLVTKTPVEMMYIDKSEVLKLFTINKIILENYLDEISNKAQFLSKKLWSLFNNRTIKEKIDEYIKSRNRNNIVIFHVSLKELADIFSVSRPSLSRVLSEYVEEGILERQGKNRYRVLDSNYFEKE
ncbi:MAG: Crp/Fnr family transcriptional regulator [Cetobacterium sp.]|uniref:Crp/Fnr family transcriptional regulator n=1 Tax=Cetobacterium sp. TaxID=2071632 RepID=UPI002FC91BC4